MVKHIRKVTQVVKQLQIQYKYLKNLINTK